jgi:choice-of-anchor A domain-containing protein
MSSMQRSLRIHVFASITASALAVAFCATSTFAASNPLESALGFNVFVRDNMALGGGHVEGATAVGGQLLANGSGIYGMSSAGSYSLAAGDALATSLLVDDGIVWSGSLNVGGRTVTSTTDNIQLNRGWVALGSTTGTHYWGDSGMQAWTSTTASNYRLNASTTSRDTTPGLLSNVSQAATYIARDSAINFDTKYAQFQATSTTLSTMADNYASRTFSGNTLNIALKQGQTNIVSLTAAEFQSVQNLNVSGTLSSNTGLIFDVSGSAVTFGSFNPVSVSLAAYILYNFAEATSVTMVDRSISGSILAPNAAFSRNTYDANGTLVSSSTSNIDGQVIVASYLQTGSGEIHNVLLDMTVVPEPAACAALLGAFALLVVWKRRQAQARG